MGRTYNSSNPEVGVTTLGELYDIIRNHIDASMTNMIGSAAPSSPVSGMMWYNSGNSHLYIYDGNMWMGASAFATYAGVSFETGVTLGRTNDSSGVTCWYGTGGAPMYKKADNHMYSQDDGGTETKITGVMELPSGLTVAGGVSIQGGVSIASGITISGGVTTLSGVSVGSGVTVGGTQSASGVTVWFGSEGAAIYKDMSANGELQALNDNGDLTQLTSHRFDMFSPDPNEPYPWSFSAQNSILGKRINVDLAKLARIVEAMSGESIIYYQDIPKKEVTKERKESLPQWMQDRLEEK